MDYYKRYMGDYGRDTGRLSMLEHGAYTLLLDDYYSTREPLPADLEGLYRICRATTKPEQAAVGVVANKYFPVCEDGKRHNGRADEEIAKWDALSAQASEAGRAGAQKRWERVSGQPPSGSGGRNSGRHDSRYSGGDSERHGRRHSKPHPVSDGGNDGSPTPIPIPDPEARSLNQNHAQDARARPGNGTGSGQETSVDTLSFEQTLMATFPKGPNAPNWGAALHHARQLVSDELATWGELIDVTKRYAAFLAAGGASVNVAAHNFFDRRKGNYWQQPWQVSERRSAEDTGWTPPVGDPKYDPAIRGGK